MRCFLTLFIVLLLTSCSTQPVGVERSVPHSTLTTTDSVFYLHGSGSYNNPPNLFLDVTASADTQAKYKDSAGVHFSGGNPWHEVGIWSADASLVSGSLVDLSDLHIWAGLKNSDDQGTHFNVRAEVWQDYDTGPLVG